MMVWPRSDIRGKDGRVRDGRWLRHASGRSTHHAGRPSVTQEAEGRFRYRVVFKKVRQPALAGVTFQTGSPGTRRAALRYGLRVFGALP